MLNRLLVNGQFARIWLAGGVSSVGDFVFDTTVLLWITTVLARGQPWAPAAAPGVLIRTVPREVLGRVFATFIPAIQSMGIAGVAVAGWLSSSVLRNLDARVLGVHFGTYDTIFLAGGVIVMLAGVSGAAALRGAGSTG